MRHRELQAGSCRQSLNRLCRAVGGVIGHCVVRAFLTTCVAMAIGGTASAHLCRGVSAAGSPPTIVQEPASTAVCSGSSAVFNVVAGGTGPFTYEWRRNGSPLIDDGVIIGAMTDTLTILTATANASIDVVVSNSGGSVTSNAALLSVGGPADFNYNGRVTSADFFMFIAAWVEDRPAGDFNHDGKLNSQDVFDFLTAFFTGC